MHATADRAKTPAAAPPVSGLLQRQCACGGATGPTGECAECRKKRVQRRALAGGAGPATAPPIVHDVPRSSGLDAGARGELEPRPGHSFADVRVHADAGRDGAFGAGWYAPGSAEGDRWIADVPMPVVRPRGASSPRLQASPDPAAKRNEEKPAGVPVRFRMECFGTKPLKKEKPQPDTRFMLDLTDPQDAVRAKYFEKGLWMGHAGFKLGSGRGPREPEFRGDLGNSLSGGFMVGKKPRLDLALAAKETAGIWGMLNGMVKAFTPPTRPSGGCRLILDRSPPFPLPKTPLPVVRTPQLQSDLLSGRRRYPGSLGVPPLRMNAPGPAVPAAPTRDTNYRRDTEMTTCVRIHGAASFDYCERAVGQSLEGGGGRTTPGLP